MADRDPEIRELEKTLDEVKLLSFRTDQTLRETVVPRLQELREFVGGNEERLRALEADVNHTKGAITFTRLLFGALYGLIILIVMAIEAVGGA